MNLYLESSAALRDLLGGEGCEDIRRLLAASDVVATSRCTLAEVGRVFARLRVVEPAAAAAAAARESQFQTDSDLWVIQPVDEGIWNRCSRPFPVEPVRTLDALHLATLEKLSGVIDHIAVLSTDSRVRDNAKALGFSVVPD
ncbi:MAG: PIN domain-containing protein [Spirochaetia bacterium]